MNLIKKKSLDIAQVLDILIIYGFALFFGKILSNGEVHLYVHPRIIPYLKYASYYLLLILPFMFRGLMKRKPVKVDFSRYAIVGVTLLLAFVVPATAINSGNAGNRSSFSSSLPINQGNIASPENNGSTAGIAGGDSWTYVGEPKKENGSGEELIIDSANFLTAIDDISVNLNSNIGKKVQLYGFVYREKGMQPNEYVVGRYLMSCCTADLSIAGLLCYSEDGDSLQSDDWISIEGTVEEGEYDGNSLPRIRVTGIKSIPKPVDEYVYP